MQTFFECRQANCKCVPTLICSTSLLLTTAHFIYSFSVSKILATVVDQVFFLQVVSVKVLRFRSPEIG